MRRWVYISHMALGFSGALCFLVVMGVVAYNAPLIHSLAAHVDQAAANGVTASGVVANAAAQQATQAVAIERDIRAEAWHIDRMIQGIDKTTGAATALLNTTNAQMEHVGPLLDSIKKGADAVPGTLGHVNDVADAAKGAVTGAKDDADAIHARLTDKRIDDLMDYLHDTGKHVAGMSASGDKILADGQWKAHQLLHPDKVKLGFWGTTWAGFKYVHDEVVPKISLF